MRILLIISAVAAVTASLDLISILTFAGYTLKADALGVAMVAVAMFLPLTLLNNVYTHAAQNFSARWVLFFSLLFRAIATGAMFYVQDIFWLVIFVALRSAAIGFFYPVIASLAQDYQKQSNFAALSNLINSGARVIAPLVGGVLGVWIGEQSVFVVSALACLLVLPVVLFGIANTRISLGKSKDDVANHQFEMPNGDLWLKLGVPIIGVSGLSVMMSNLMPYTMNLFDVPKIVLSIALSCSAATGILINIAFVKWGSRSSEYPRGQLAIGWFLTCIGFVALALSVPTQFSPFLIPLFFTLLTASKATFTVALTGFIFAQPKKEASRLASFDQTLGSVAGMLTTLVGALSLTSPSPIPMMPTASAIGFASVVIWWMFAGLRDADTVR